jgi:hypothetical protein
MTHESKRNRRQALFATNAWDNLCRENAIMNACGSCGGRMAQLPPQSGLHILIDA